ncbi:MAG: phosphotransferase [Demequinaceae bacterium]|nr:phosphotransferase [Demequinaceae bacterium]
MSHSPLALAALATVAVPEIDIYDVLRSPNADADFDVVTVVDPTGKRWTVRAPRRPAAGAALEAELGLLAFLAEACDAGDLSFDVPRPVGTAPLKEGGRAVVYEEIRGKRLNLAALEPGQALSSALGRAVAQVHELPVSVIEDAGLPSYTPETYRQRRLAELDAAAQTGKIPPRLSGRWEERLENLSWWRFEPTVVHGGLAEHQLIVTDGAVTGVIGWADARVADPADDLAWLIVAAPPDVFETVLGAYLSGRKELLDPHLTDRASLASEFALARWLMHGVRTDSSDIVRDAEGMLSDLETLLEESGEL